VIGIGAEYEILHRLRYHLFRSNL